MIAAGDDNDVVPIVEPKQVFEFLLGNQFIKDLFAFVGPRGLFTNEADSPSFATFVIDEGSPVGQVFFVADLVLIATDNPRVSRFFCGRQVSGAILNTRVICGVAAEG